MAIRVQCECGKSFQVVEALAGKKARCPQCNTMIPVPGGDPLAATATAPATATATLAAPPRPKAAPKVTKYDAHAATTRKEDRAVPSVTLSPKTVMFLCALVGVPLLIFLVKIGPVKAMDQWRELEPKLNAYTDDAVRTVCLEQYKGVQFDEFMRPPKVLNVMIDGPILMFTMPSAVPVQGRSTEGTFKGTYFVREKRFELEIGVGGDYRTLKVKSHVDDKGYPVIDEEK